MADLVKTCELCAQNGVCSFLKLHQINFDEAVYLCSKPECTYPIGTAVMCVTRSWKEIPATKHGKGSASLPKFDNKALAGVGSIHSKKRVHSAKQSFPPHPPKQKPAMPSVYVPNFAPSNSPTVSRKLNFGSNVPSTPSKGQQTSSQNGKPPTPRTLQSKVDCIPDYLRNRSVMPQQETLTIPDLSDMNGFSGLNSGNLNEMNTPSKVKPVKKTNSKFARNEQLSNGASISQGITPTPSSHSSNGEDRNAGEETKANGVKSSAVEERKDLASALKSLWHIQWSNKDALCWLDVAMNLLVHSRLFHQFVKSRPTTACPIVKHLLEQYTKAQAMLTQARELKRYQLIGQTRTVVLETSVGMVSVRTGGGDGTDVLPTTTTKPETLVVKTSLSPLISKCEASSQNDQRMVVTTQQLESRSDQLGESAREILNTCRESVWRYLYPKLRCEKGENDSPVFALPLLLGEDPVVKEDLTHNFEWRMTCSACGYEHQDSVSKVLLTFPAVPTDFSMNAPYFLRSCFQCGAPDQRLNMHHPAPYPSLLVAHFVEGVHKDPARYDFFLRGSVFSVTGVVQYRHQPDHFVAWIRHPQLNLWLELDDLQRPIARYTDTQPSFPPSQVHLLMWTKKPSRGQPLDNLPLYLSPQKTAPAAAQPKATPGSRKRPPRKKPAPKSTTPAPIPKPPLEMSLTSPPPPLRSALRSPQKKMETVNVVTNARPINGLNGFRNGNGKGLVHQKKDVIGVKPPVLKARKGLSKLVKKNLDKLNVTDLAKILTKGLKSSRTKEQEQQGKKPQYEGYIPKTVAAETPKVKQTSATSAAKTQSRAQTLKSVCFKEKSRTPTPEPVVAKSIRSRKRKASDNLPTTLALKLAKIETDIANIEPVPLLPNASNGEEKPSDEQSNGLDKAIEDLCKNLDIPELDMSKVDTTTPFSMDDIDIIFDEKNGATENNMGNVSVDDFNLDMFF